MLKFFNGAATITYRPDTAIVHVLFNNSGSYRDYVETIRVAEGMAHVHHSTAYLIEKNTFDNLSISEYGRFSVQWMYHLNQHSNAEQWIAWQTLPHAFSALLDYYYACRADTAFARITYNVFASSELSIRFLRTNEL